MKEKEDETFKQITEKESQLVTLRGQIVALEGRITESEVRVTIGVFIVDFLFTKEKKIHSFRFILKTFQGPIART